MSNRPVRRSRREQTLTGLAMRLPAMRRAVTAPARSTLVRIALAAAVAMTALLASAPAARAQGAIPTVTSVAPVVAVEDGRPIRITITGRALTGVTDVAVDPAVPQHSIQVISDAAVVVTFPAELAPGRYDMVLTSDAGSSLPGTAAFTVEAAPATPLPDPGPAVLPQVSFAPITSSSSSSTATSSAAAAPAGAGRPAGGQVVVAGTDHNPLNNPLFALAFGIVVGGGAFVLWATRGPDGAARRRDLVAHVVGPPARALHLGRNCRSCGRLHTVLTTRRDLWRAGLYCSATCVATSREEAATLRTSGARLREVTRYPDLERQLEMVLAAEARLMRTPSVLFADPFAPHSAVNGSLHLDAPDAPDAPGAPDEDPTAVVADPADAAAPPAVAGWTVSIPGPPAARRPGSLTDTLLAAADLNAAAKLAATFTGDGRPGEHSTTPAAGEVAPARATGGEPAGDPEAHEAVAV